MKKKTEIPVHIAIIMDGNGRWAKKRNLPRIFGHREGAKSVREITTACAELGVKYLTLYAFSTENWKRPENEIKFLFNLLDDYLVKERKTLIKNNIKFRVIGDIKKLPSNIIKKIVYNERITKNNTGLNLILALNYGTRSEIINAVNKIANDVKSGKIKKNKITEELFNNYLYTKGIPDPDLLIRTSGEMRVSNFLLWQIAYSEIYVTKTLWPDFRKKELLKAINEFNKRERRFGGL
jgi:undecaprenyl diphosphate synthase